MRTFFILFYLSTLAMWGQVNSGELRLRVVDGSGAGVRASVEVVSQGNGYDKGFSSDDAGALNVAVVPYGVYRVKVTRAGFAPAVRVVVVRSALPVEEKVELAVAGVVTQVSVEAGETTLIDPYSPSSVMQVGTKQIEKRVTSLPGRSVQDLVNTQPGWLYEGNSVLHPRGSEYQTQFVVDGIPLTDNRSPSFGPEIEADDLDSMRIYTAGYPAEYGRKMGGVVELNTRRQTDVGLHGQVVAAGGSYDSLSGYGRVQELAGKNTFGASMSGAMTSHYLNPVVPENYTNNGTIGDFAGSYERDLTESDRLSFTVRHELSRFEIPNEYVQQAAGQLLTGDNFETMGIVQYQRIISPDSLVSLSGMVRDNANDLNSNDDSTPIIAFQHNYFREGYFKGTYSLHKGRHEIKAGVESDAAWLHEDFHYNITDPDHFDPDTPQSLTFKEQRLDWEQSGFVEDLIRLGNWTVSAGLRWDHYQLLLNENAVSPRVSVGRYFPQLGMVVHGSYDRIFQTPSFENILISSSPEIDALSDNFLRLPVKPSRGDYFEGGATKSFADRVRLDANVYRRDVRNFADDDQLLNTGVSYPIAFDKSVIYGAEGKLTVVALGALSGYASYSYMVGNVWWPVTGGLFLGDDADAAAAQTTGHFPNSQDQRNTVRTRFQYGLGRRAWVAAGAEYGSGLPFKYGGEEQDALEHHGPAVISRLDFERRRVKPQMAVSASLGAYVYTSERMKMRFQADGSNLNNRLNVIDFGGLFSGNAIGPGRSFAVRLTANF
jgi:hypothetical protein